MKERRSEQEWNGVEWADDVCDDLRFVAGCGETGWQL
jgi:hypothetical protein